jgi:hypothetical protein
MSDTPLTDARVVFFGYNPDEGDEFVQADFARNLERQNTALREALKLVMSNVPGVTDSVAQTPFAEAIRRALAHSDHQQLR